MVVTTYAGFNWYNLIGATTFVELEARASGGRHSLLVRGQTKFIPSKVIASTISRFKRRRVLPPWSLLL
jgi:hypothetical protein